MKTTYTRYCMAPERDWCLNDLIYSFSVRSLTHVLLLKPYQYSPLQIEVFGRDILDNLCKEMLENHSTFNNGVDENFKKDMEILLKVKSLDDSPFADLYGSNTTHQPLRKAGIDMDSILSQLHLRKAALRRQSFEYRVLHCLTNM